ncbi:MAG: ABC transporter ATP-binding protein [Beijerinckiaceae bacterium]
MIPTLEPVGIEIENADLSYGSTHVLKNVSLSIRPGEFFAFLGPSGCGKTTLLRLIAGFNMAQRGRVVIGGRDISPLPPWARDVGMVFQSYALWPHMSVAKNVAFGLEERRLPRDEIAARVDAALDLVNLKHLKDRKPSQLSGGQQQRVALARTVAVRPKVLLLDEPLSNLDAKMRVEVRRELRALQQTLKLTTIFVTHDQEEANTVCDRIAVMNDGSVQQVGTPMELYDRPANLFVANFLGSANILAASDGKIMFRPQHVRLSSTAGHDGMALEGTVMGREFLGGVLRYTITTTKGEIIADEPYGLSAVLREVGEQVIATVSSIHMRALPAA